MSSIYASASTEDRMIDALDHSSDTELFELLDAKTQQALQLQFSTKEIDDDDRESFIFSLIDEHDGKDRYEIRERASRLWDDFLQRSDLLNVYRQEIERNWLDQNADDYASDE